VAIVLVNDLLKEIDEALVLEGSLLLRLHFILLGVPLYMALPFLLIVILDALVFVVPQPFL